ncbi:PAS domain-containing protein [Thermophagus xiamenensis]|uniref:histidine kinase n=1 Tax=Thermophagus xiamenensis TaxID=385682 RepID=A0A1I2FEV0_9BACT|nr:PAS domain-containing protein [Thermophagus xiamenensis]SFF03429.1 PAS domain S-box-containing protein [Thermophagus xiamenensis]
MTISDELKRAKEQIRYLERELATARQRENEFYRIIDTLDSHIFRCRKNEKGDIIPLFSAGRIAQRYRLKNNQVIGKKLREVLGEKTYAELEPYYNKAFEGQSAEYRGFLYGKRFFSVMVIPFLRGPTGQVEEVVGIIHDITEVHITQLEAQRNSEVLNRFIDYNPYSIQILDSKGYHIRENKAFLNLFKTRPGKNWSLMDDWQVKNSGLNELLSRVLQGEVVETPPVWYNAHLTDSKYPNNPICVGSVIFPVFLSSGKLEYIVLIHEDITSRVKAEKALRSSERRMKNILMTNPAVIYTSEVNKPWNWTFISENVFRLTGYSCHDFLRNEGLWINCIHPDDRDRVQSGIPLVFEEGYHITEYRFKCKNGEYIWILDESRIVMGDDGQPVWGRVT